jgi:hypothetical protein
VCLFVGDTLGMSQGFGINDPHTDFWIGNNYATVWPTITDVISTLYERVMMRM